MLQSYSAQQQQAVLYEDRGSAPALAHYLAVAKRRLRHFLIPFIVILGVGGVIVAVQRPIYLAEGRILVETQDIPADLVRPTVTDTANQRIQIIQQRIMTRDNLLAIVNKFGLFARQREWMSGTQLLDLMKERTQLKLVDLTRPTQQNNLTIALTLSFEYENPELAMRVANEFLTLILNEDARTRTNRAMETTKFLARETKRLEGELGAIDAQISELRRRPRTTAATINLAASQINMQLANAKADLAQKSALYSPAHPDVKMLKKKVAALEEIAAKTPQTPQTAQIAPSETGLEEVERQRLSIEKNLEEANHKLTAARLGESLERDQQSERLQVIEQPALPQKPIKPNVPKLLAMVFALAAMAGVGVAVGAESLDGTIRTSQDLVGTVEKHLIVAIPYISTIAETSRKKRRSRIRLWGLGITLLAALSIGLYFAWSTDAWVGADVTLWGKLKNLLDPLTRLSK
jgi:uncharacterized protein involved in exopolysaccharide biosynthesis